MVPVPGPWVGTDQGYHVTLHVLHCPSALVCIWSPDAGIQVSQGLRASGGGCCGARRTLAGGGILFGRTNQAGERRWLPQPRELAVPSGGSSRLVDWGCEGVSNANVGLAAAVVRPKEGCARKRVRKSLFTRQVDDVEGDRASPVVGSAELRLVGAPDPPLAAGSYQSDGRSADLDMQILWAFDIMRDEAPARVADGFCGGPLKRSRCVCHRGGERTAEPGIGTRYGRYGGSKYARGRYLSMAGDCLEG